jgi:hypothetical protein
LKSSCGARRHVGRDPTIREKLGHTFDPRIGSVQFVDRGFDPARRRFVSPPQILKKVSAAIGGGARWDRRSAVDARHFHRTSHSPPS